MIDVKVVNLDNGRCNLIVEIVGIIVTLLTSFLTLRLQCQQNKFQEKEDIIKKQKHCNNIYYLISDLALKLGNMIVDKEELKSHVFDIEKYNEDISYLRYNILTKEECDILMELLSLYDNLCGDKDIKISQIKPIYNIVIDKYMNPEEVSQFREEKRIEEIVSVQLLMIMYKLKKEITKNYKYSNNSIIKIHDSKKELTLEKKYSKEKQIKYSDGVINGNVDEYVKIFYNDKYTTYEKIFEGNIFNNRKEGNGKYFYYTMNSDFASGVNSIDLCVRNINYDVNAQKIVEILKKNGISTNCYVVFEGVFKNNIIQAGNVQYRLSSKDPFKNIELN